MNVYAHNGCRREGGNLYIIELQFLMENFKGNKATPDGFPATLNAYQ
jgi:hypothetical protein